jgi:hypothetical protein
MFALNLGIGYSDDLKPEYQVSCCLVGLGIRAVYWGSISRWRSVRQKTRRADVEGLASTSLGIVEAALPMIENEPPLPPFSLVQPAGRDQAAMAA